MHKIIKVFFNGQFYYLKKNITLFDLITYFNYDNYLLVLEYNDTICNKEIWGEIFLRNYDKIEIVTIVGGG